MHWELCFQASLLATNGWYKELLKGDGAWLEAFPPPSRPTQAVISLSPPKVLEFVKIHSLNLPRHTPPLISVLSFDDWTSLLWTAAHDKPAFPALTKSLVMHAREKQQEDLLIEVAIRNELAVREKSLVELWGAKPAFHAGLISADSRNEVDASRSDEEEEDEGLILTEEEKAFHTQLMATSRVDMAKAVEENQRSEVNRYTRNAFLPLAPSRWLESESVRLDYKLWDMATYNHSAPINEKSYQFLASLTHEEMRLCKERSLSENIELIRGNYPLTANDMNLPLVGEIDRTKYVVTRPALAVRGFLAAKGQPAMVELKRIWNVGRPYLKCRCVQEGKGDCKKNITWLDHIFWFLLANLEYLFPAAPTLRARIRAFRVIVKGRWRAAVLASVVFYYMREIMEMMAVNVLSDPTRRPDNILDDRSVMMHKFTRTMAQLMLPPRFVTEATRRKRRSTEADNEAGTAKRAKQTTLSFYVRPQHDHSPVMTPGAPAMDDTPPSSCVSTQADGQTSASSTAPRRSPRGLTMAKSLFKS
ncbi:hypothetical protein CBR_g48922 [Chara braunii]|uniref:Uncharacterized protein n=1 Tax=Chara braunii TaxID=69332 RepID=A0A388M3R3_CHABU|nr:hypothetical protein CBR_g48922 [Chara braunii]|eukprot:GBG89214.1 hypothetical protein CBR_g48922 [Chara braunii]